MLIEKENFISNDLCDFFIRYHNINSQHHTKHRNTSILDCEEHSLKENFAFNLLIKKIKFFCRGKCKKYSYKLFTNSKMAYRRASRRTYRF